MGVLGTVVDVLISGRYLPRTHLNMIEVYCGRVCLIYSFTFHQSQRANSISSLALLDAATCSKFVDLDTNQARSLRQYKH